MCLPGSSVECDSRASIGKQDQAHPASHTSAWRHDLVSTTPLPHWEATFRPSSISTTAQGQDARRARPSLRTCAKRPTFPAFVRVSSAFQYMVFYHRQSGVPTKCLLAKSTLKADEG
ncbi:hypothetical protein E2C01_016521 [Portunus trituberculatus]|uniref:Uncharacterized protein n=1 Tax=Portunus trituberculatus TaxID=210409 RepID=A0A5B7DR48_PORTR|nr:hypothetical protein [Portunus trituberculatus]